MRVQHTQPRQQAELFYQEHGAVSDEAQAKTPTLAPSQDPEPEWECPDCGSTDGTPVDYDFGRCSETGYHDTGETCTRCFSEAK